MSIGRLFFFLASLIPWASLMAQQDSMRFPGEMNDGIYLTYDDFRRNNAIVKEQVVSSLDKEQLEFIGKVMFEEKLTFKINNGTDTRETKTIWGFFQNRTLYVNFRGDFFRVPVFGSICYLVATVVVVNPGFYDPMFGYGNGSSRSKEIREFIMNFYDGRVLEFTEDRVEELLSRDLTLYAEFKKLSRRKQREQIHRYIRKYNDLHPVYFLK